MSKEEYPVTPAVRLLRSKGIAFTPFVYDYEAHGGTRQFAEEFQVPEHNVVKTLVFETDGNKPFLLLMHGDCEVSAKELARILGVKQVALCAEGTAQRNTGYRFGGTSPFGTRLALPVIAEKTIFELSSVYINGGKRGFIIEMASADIKNVLAVTEVEVARPGRSAV